MPSPLGGRVNPDDLARSVARHLADTAPGSVKGSLRDSVLLARVFSGVIVLIVAGTLVLGVFGGVNWLLGRERTESAAASFDPESFFAADDSTTTTGSVVDEVAAVGITASSLAHIPVAQRIISSDTISNVQS